MLENLLKAIFGSKHEREVRRVQPLVAEINQRFGEWESLSDDDLRAKTAEFRTRLAFGDDTLVPFRAGESVAWRVLGSGAC